MNNNNERQLEYKTLHDISRRKAEILNSIRKDQKMMGELWNDMFKPQKKSGKKGLSLQTIMNTGVGVVDGALFAWKMYRKFKK